jgi:SAM-dependent methyltransferase
MQVYDDVFVPRLFEPWGRRLLAGLELEPGEAVLDVACGPGSATRLAAVAVGPIGKVTGVDLSPAMLGIAQAKPALPDAAPIDYHEAPADRLPVADGAFDAAVCQQGLQFFPDRPAALREMARALRPGGRVGIAVWTAIDDSPCFAALAGAIGDIAGPELAARYRGGPWGLTNADQLRSLLEEAGFEEVRVERVVLPLPFENVAQMQSTLAASGIAAELEALSAEQKEELGSALERRVDAAGALNADAASHLVYGRR